MSCKWFHLLPAELLVHVCGFLDASDLARLHCLGNRRLADVLATPCVWRRVCASDLGLVQGRDYSDASPPSQVYAGYARSAAMWRGASPQLARRRWGSGIASVSVSWSRDTVLVCDESSRVALYPLQQLRTQPKSALQPVAECPASAEPCAASCFIQDDSVVVTGDSRGCVRVWRPSAHTGAVAACDTAPSPDVPCRLMAVAPLGASGRVVTGGKQRAWHVVDTTVCAVATSRVPAHAGAIWDVCGDQAGHADVFATASYDRSVCVWDTRASSSAPPVATAKHALTANAVDLCSQTQRLWTGGGDASLAMWDLRNVSGGPIAMLERAHGDAILCVRRVASHIVTCSYDGMASLWTMDATASALTPLAQADFQRASVRRPRSAAGLASSVHSSANVADAMAACAASGAVAYLLPAVMAVDLAPDWSSLISFTSSHEICLWHL